jgi:IPT/TIG domain-containing protein
MEGAMLLSRKSRRHIGGTLAAGGLFVFILAGCTDWTRHDTSQPEVRPYLIRLLPSSVPVGASSQTLTINGSGFLASSAVTFDGVAHQVTFTSSAKLSILLSNTDLRNIGDFPVTVTNGSAAAGGYLRVQGGNLQLSFTGLPAEQRGNVSVTSPDGFREVISSTQAIQVPPATYLISANGVGAGGLNYYSDPAAQSVSIADGSSGSIEVSYKNGYRENDGASRPSGSGLASLDGST